MNLIPEDRLGPYVIVGALGVGGMGEVYRARDTRLGRDVAIKVLPAALAGDADRVARFRREAKILAALNHPNVAAIYGLETTDRATALILELVEGPTLEDRLARGAMPFENALPIACQIADALEAAHDHDIIHRDLKPANIKLGPDDTVKVLDFGLAKVLDAPGVRAAGPAETTAFAPAMTGVGVILGTAGYMSPEQAAGGTTDRRTDVWSFGVVLFEMLSGRRLFPGPTVEQVLAQVLSAEIDWSALPRNTPPSIRRLLRRCLQRDRRMRLPDIGVARLEIDEARGGSDRTNDAGTAAESSSRARRAAPWAAAVVLAAVGALAVWATSAEPPPPKLVVMPMDLPLSNLMSLEGRGIALSPDGATLVYAATQDGSTMLYRRPFDQLEAVPIAGTAGVSSTPVFSSDGASIVFPVTEPGQPTTTRRLMLADGTSTPLFRGSFTSATWETDESLVIAPPGSGQQLQRVSVSGRTPRAAVTLRDSDQEMRHQSPHALPGGKALLFEVIYGSREPQVAVQILATGDRWELVAGSAPRYLATGHLVFYRNGSLWAVPFDPERLTITGGPIQVVENVDRNGFAIATNGTLVYLTPSASYARTLAWVDHEGHEEALPGAPRAYNAPRLSPDGTRLAVQVGELNSEDADIWVRDLASNREWQLTFSPGADAYPLWTLDSQRIVSSSARTGVRNLFWRSADGDGVEEPLTAPSATIQSPWDWSANGETLMVQEQQPKTGWDVRTLKMTGERRAADDLLARPGAQQYPRVSPDGKWIAYRSTELGGRQVYVSPFPNVNGGGPWRVSDDGGSEPAWAPDGRTIFYIDLEGRLLAVPVTTQPVFRQTGTPRVLFEGRDRYHRPDGSPSYDVSPNGQRFLMIKLPVQTDRISDQRKLIVWFNWFEALKRLVPAK